MSTKSFYFSVDTSVLKADIHEINNAPSSNCPLPIFLAIVRGLVKICNYGSAVDQGAVSAKRLLWQKSTNPSLCLVDAHFDASALKWIDVLCQALHSSHQLVRLFAEKQELPSSSTWSSLDINPLPRSNPHSKIVVAMINASLLSLTREEKRRLWHGVEQIEAYIMLTIFEALLNDKESKFIYTQFMALDQQLRSAHPHITKAVKAEAEHRRALHAESEMAKKSKASRTHVLLAETRLSKDAKDHSETSTSTNSESDYSISSCESPLAGSHLKNTRNAKPENVKFKVDLEKLRACNFPMRCSSVISRSAEWNPTNVFQTGLIWEPCAIDGRTVMKPRNLPNSFSVGRMGWYSIW